MAKIEDTTVTSSDGRAVELSHTIEPDGAVTIRAQCDSCVVEHRVTFGAEHGPVDGYGPDDAQRDLDAARAEVAERAAGVARRHELVAKLK